MQCCRGLEYDMCPSCANIQAGWVCDNCGEIKPAGLRFRDKLNPDCIAEFPPGIDHYYVSRKYEGYTILYVLDKVANGLWEAF